MVALTTTAEERARAAEGLPAFRDVNLLGIKSKAAEVLSLIGRDGLFREYTLHDVSHIDKMLGTLDWLIPDASQDAMTPADWLLVVLGIYFHDLGMLVTSDEFGARETSGFPGFVADTLYAGAAGAEYKSKVAALGPDAADRFLYQEFVRANHADRVADWITGRASRLTGVAESTAGEVTSILSGLSAEFRHDLALVCQSHHLNDLHDVQKYPVAQPYGDSDAETANVQYAALLLRSADLLHITSDRTPSVMFRLINPQDPVSQREWAKQAGVRRVRPQKGRDREGNASDSAPKDTIEVFATFSDAEGFFGLTSYLRYAETQLRLTYDWARRSRVDHAVPHQFPWRHIDDTAVTATGFSPQRLSFSLDQEKILDLLTGHTLYNDTTVVIRELVQNALDAARLQALIDGEHVTAGRVEIEWSDAERTLVVRDNGTGMSQSVIERNLLRAGASRYQEEEFKKQFADFSPISRFGIGVLSTFMIADSVEITTCSEDEHEARRLTLRSVHGRYLVRLLDKEADATAAALSPHGTEVRLRVRQSAELPDVLATLTRWVVIPGCVVTATLDSEEPIQIGYPSPAAAIAAAATAAGAELAEGADPADGAVKVVEVEHEGVVTAFAVRWSRYFQEWSFFPLRRPAPADLERAVGTCVEGIRVEHRTPGYDENVVLALSNATGPAGPKTNVARSGLESTAERSAMLRRIYRAYCDHVASECEQLVRVRHQSLTWAAQEAEFLFAPLFDRDGRARGPAASPTEPQGFRDELRLHKVLLLEAGGERRLAAAVEFEGEEIIWTIDSAFLRAAESLLRELPGTASYSALAEAFGRPGFSLPEGPALIGFKPQSPLYQTLFLNRQVREIVIRREQRRIDLGWEVIRGEPAWVNLIEGLDPGLFSPTRTRMSDVYVACQERKMQGAENEIAVRAQGSLYILPDNPLADYLIDASQRLAEERSAVYRLYIAECVHTTLTRAAPPEDLRRLLERIARSGMIDSQEEFAELAAAVDFEAMLLALEASIGLAYDTWAWARRNDFGVL